MLKIVQAPNLVLSQPTKPINKIDKEINQLIKEMKETLVAARDPEGVGLAAPQVDKSIQLFIIKQTSRSPILVFINPKIEQFLDKSEIDENQPEISEDPKKEKNVQLEGCLSLSGIWGVVNRHPTLVLSYEDETGQKHRKKFTGFIATIIQHEYDHLQGTLFPKRVLEQKNPLYKSKKDEKGETEFEEIKL